MESKIARLFKNGNEDAQRGIEKQSKNKWYVKGYESYIDHRERLNIRAASNNKFEPTRE